MPAGLKIREAFSQEEILVLDLRLAKIRQWEGIPGKVGAFPKNLEGGEARHLQEKWKSPVSFKTQAFTHSPFFASSGESSWLPL